MDSICATVSRYLTAELERLDKIDAANNREELDSEIERAKAISLMAKVAVENAQVCVDVARVSAKLETPASKLLPRGAAS